MTCLTCNEPIPEGARGPVCDACLDAAIADWMPGRATPEQAERLARVNADLSARLAAMPAPERRRTLDRIRGCV